MRIMVFHATGNLGDTIQSVALSRLVGPSKGWFRDHAILGKHSENDVGVAAGFLLGQSGYSPEKTIFCGIWFPTYDPHHLAWLRRCQHTIGARDPETNARLLEHKIPSEMVGCATLTLPVYKGPRSGEISVDVDGPGEKFTHSIPTDTSFNKEWSLALEALDRYRKASVVHTTRIHVAMPALAMGTPVRYVGPQDWRTSIMKAIGVKHGEVCLPDVSWLRERYITFLGRHIGKLIRPFPDPIKPEVPNP